MLVPRCAATARARFSSLWSIASVMFCFTKSLKYSLHVKYVNPQLIWEPAEYKAAALQRRFAHYSFVIVIPS